MLRNRFSILNITRALLLLAMLMFMAGCPKPVKEINQFATASEGVFSISTKALDEFKTLSSTYNIYQVAKATNNGKVTQSDFTDPYKKIATSYDEKDKHLTEEQSIKLAAAIDLRIQALTALKDYASGINDLVNADIGSQLQAAATSISKSTTRMYQLTPDKKDSSIPALLGTSVYAAGTLITDKMKFDSLKSAVDRANGPIQEMSKQIQIDASNFSKLAVLMLGQICSVHIRYYNDYNMNFDLEKRIAILKKIQPTCQASVKVKTFAQGVDKAAELFASAHAKIKADLDNGGTDFESARATIERLVATGKSVKEVYDSLLNDKK